MDKLLKENIVCIAILLAVFACGVMFTFKQASDAMATWQQVITTSKDLDAKKEELAKILKDKEEEELKIQQGMKKETESGKVIYEMLGQQISPEASFGILIENTLKSMTDAGIRIRSVDYNFTVSDDKIVQTNIPGYNACELSFLAVGTYTQFQTFFKDIAKNKYLSGINEVYIEPYDKDKTILIARFKVRLYTKTI